jgi:hypothetical protein
MIPDYEISLAVFNELSCDVASKSIDPEAIQSLYKGLSSIIPFIHWKFPWFRICD